MGIVLNDEEMTYVVYEKVFHTEDIEETRYIDPIKIKELITMIEGAERKGYKPVEM